MFQYEYYVDDGYTGRNFNKQEIATAKELGLIEGNENNDIWSLRNKLLDDVELLKYCLYIFSYISEKCHFRFLL